MKRGIGAMIMAAAVGLASNAQADDKARPGAKTGTKEEMKEMRGAKAPEVAKHLALVDVYLTSAINNTKALASLSEMSLAKEDKPIVEEVNKNLDMSIDRATTHLDKVKSAEGMGMHQTAKGVSAEKQPVAGGELARLDELERHLTEAKSSAKALKTAKIDQLDAAIDAVSTHLKAAEEIFRDVAKSANLTRLEDVQLGRIPVKGKEMEREHQKTPEMPPAQKPAQPMKPPSGY